MKRAAAPTLTAMRVGIDFGTTHTVAAVVDRGNYPIVSFDGVDTWPSVIAANGAGELRFGLDAAAVRHDPGWAVLRSFKRLLSEAGPRTTVDSAGHCYRVADVARTLRTIFDEKRVKRSLHPFAATAIGLAAFLDNKAGFALSERLSRHFGVFREALAGDDVCFDPIVPKGTQLPTAGQPPYVVTRTYRAAHNIGHFRFVECSRLRDGHPDGDVTPYDLVFFPFDPDLDGDDELPHRPVRRRDDGPDVEERYVVTSGGAVEVTLTTRPAQLSRMFRLARHDLASA